jgi:hypothetical protein
MFWQLVIWYPTPNHWRSYERAGLFQNVVIELRQLAAGAGLAGLYTVHVSPSLFADVSSATD